MQYFEPNFVDEALVLLDRFGSGARMLAGGTRLGFALRSDPRDVAALINLKRIRELDEIEERDGILRIGALVTAHRIATSPAIRKHAPVLARAAGSMGARQLRSIATLGGNICSGDPASDLAVALVACGARCEVAGVEEPSGMLPLERWLDERATGPRSKELVGWVHVPITPHVGAYEKMTQRRGFEMALVAVAFSAHLEGDALRDVRIALGGVGPAVLRARGAEAMLDRGRFSTASLSEAARTAAESDAHPTDDARASAEYRRHLVTTLVERAIRNACGDIAGMAS